MLYSSGDQKYNSKLKDKFTYKSKLGHYPVALLLMGSRVKFRRPQIISGPLQQNCVAASALTTDVIFFGVN